MDQLIQNARVDDEHQKVLDLIRSGEVMSASRFAARLINSGEGAGFFTVPSPSIDEARLWFNGMVSASASSEFSKSHIITPALAQVILERNQDNRNVKANSLSDYIRDMRDGRWQLNGSSITIADTGETNDGQHRCYACLLSRSPFKSFLTFGVSRKSRETEDMGAKRTGGDRLEMDREPNPNAAAGIASTMFEIDKGRRGTQTEIYVYFDQHRDEIRNGMKAVGGNILGVGPSASGAAAIVLMRMGADPDSINRFMAAVRKNENTSSGNAARTLHLALYPISKKEPALKLDRLSMVSTLCHHYIDWRKGKRRKDVALHLPLPRHI